MTFFGLVQSPVDMFGHHFRNVYSFFRQYGQNPFSEFLVGSAPQGIAKGHGNIPAPAFITDTTYRTAFGIVQKFRF